MSCLCHYGPALLRFWFQTYLGHENSASYLKTRRGRPFVTMVTRWSRFMSIFYALIGQNLTGEFMRKIMQHLETCLLWQLKLTAFLSTCDVFLRSFPTGCMKWNTPAICSLLLFTAGLFIEFLDEKCAACQSQKSDFGWHRFHFSRCWMRVEKSLKRFWPYLIAFRSCISNGKPE